jgi:TRAP-type C4-dicarboxylate transport system permease small subunit
MGEKYEEHFCVDVFVKFLKGKPSQALRVVEKALGCVIFCVLLYWSIKFWSFQRINKSAAFGISMSIVAASMNVGFFLALIRRSVHLVKAIKLLFGNSGQRDLENSRGK